MQIAHHRLGALIEHVGIDLRRGDVGVAEEVLNDAQVRAVLQQVARESVTQDMRAGAGRRDSRRRGDAFERLRKSLGVDSLDLTSSASGSPAVGVSRAISDRISVRATTGAKPEDNGVSVDLDVARHIRLQGGVDASGGSSVGVGADWEYK